MDISLTLLALLQLSLAIVLGVGVLFGTYRLVRRIVYRGQTPEQPQTAFAVFSGAIMFSVGYLVSSVLEPLLSTFRSLSIGSAHPGQLFLDFCGYLSLFLLISSVIALLINLLGIFLFTRFTRDIDELQAIRANDLAAAISTGIIILVITLFAKESVVFLLESIVPYPEVPGGVFGA
ncbi:MAG: DUF350 domain-containing protein [Bacteroidetes bacterium]|nr:MAG: DUF350 domain-containing protein [Bacteroidota bacterium]